MILKTYYRDTWHFYFLCVHEQFHLINLLTRDTLNPSTRYVNISFWNGLKTEGCSWWILSAEISVWETEVLLSVVFSGVLKMSIMSGLKSELQKKDKRLVKSLIPGHYKCNDAAKNNLCNY